jgi:2-isopropylmalate synthase
MYDWNLASSEPRSRQRVADETLRDGLQAADAREPPLDRKIEFVRALAALRVDAASLGLPAASERARRDVSELARVIREERLDVVPTAAARTTESDVAHIADASERAGTPIEVYAFVGASPIRAFVEGWDLPLVAKRVRDSARVAKRAGLSYCLVTEDTTRTPPEVLAALWKEAVAEGAKRICICDTVGHIDQWGVAALVEFARKTVEDAAEIDWHGHNDRGLALGNALAAARAGASRVHGTAGGRGERCGNTPMEHLLTQLAAMGARESADPRDVARYSEIARANASEAAARHDDGDARPLTLTINGERVTALVAPSRTLLEFLRDDLDLIGTKQGCDLGQCGACTVLVDDAPLLGCITLAHECAGRRVDTIESLKRDARDPLLEAFDEHGAGQCGFCTSGMVLTGHALLRKNPNPTHEEIAESISSNLCRCTGYGPIIRAIDAAARARK